MKPEIVKTLELSNCHVTEEVAFLLNTKSDRIHGILWDPIEYGWLIRWWPSRTDRQTHGNPHRTDWLKLPSCLKESIVLAERNDCTMIWFDSDGPQMTDIKSYDW